MTKAKSTKKALLMSGLALLMCFSMLIGSTFAWFTDSVTSSGNIIKSGTLDVTMEWADGTKAVPAVDSNEWTDASTGAIFNYNLWEPGYTMVRHIKIANEGTLALKYQLNIVANGKVSELADVIDVYYLDPAEQIADRTKLTEDNKLGTLTQVLAKISTTASGELLAGNSDTVTLALKMQESAGNKYQGLEIGSDFSIQLLATQLTSEKDSFDDQYDAKADYVAKFTSGTHELNTTLMATKAGDTVSATGAETVVNIRGGYYDAGSIYNNCAVWAYAGATINIYDGTFTADGDDQVQGSGHHYDLIYAGSSKDTEQSYVNIYGGMFSVRNNGWLLNEADGKGNITVYGGTFVNWNPANNESEGANTNFLADGYAVTADKKANGDVWYTVVEGACANDVDSLKTVLSNAQEGDIVTLGADIAANGNLTLKSGAILYGNGYTLSNVQLYMNEGSTVQNVKFDGTQADNGSQIYAHSVSVTIKDCTFKNANWDAIQATPTVNDHIVIDGCTFAANTANNGQARSVHIEVDASKDSDGDGIIDRADTDADIKLTLTNNHFDMTQTNVSNWNNQTRVTNETTFSGLQPDKITASGNTLKMADRTYSEDELKQVIGYFHRTYTDSQVTLVTHTFDELKQIFGMTEVK